MYFSSFLSFFIYPIPLFLNAVPVYARLRGSELELVITKIMTVKKMSIRSSNSTSSSGGGGGYGGDDGGGGGGGDDGGSSSSSNSEAHR